PKHRVELLVADTTPGRSSHRYQGKLVHLGDTSCKKTQPLSDSHLTTSPFQCTKTRKAAQMAPQKSFTHNPHFLTLILTRASSLLGAVQFDRMSTREELLILFAHVQAGLQVRTTFPRRP